MQVLKPLIVHIKVKVSLQFDVKGIQVHIRILHHHIALHLGIILVIVFQVLIISSFKYFNTQMWGNHQTVILIEYHHRFILLHQIEPVYIDGLLLTLLFHWRDVVLPGLLVIFIDDDLEFPSLNQVIVDIIVNIKVLILILTVYIKGILVCGKMLEHLHIHISGINVICWRLNKHIVCQSSYKSFRKLKHTLS